MSAKKAVSKNKQTRSSGSDSVPCSGRVAYEADCKIRPNYHDGSRRATWDELGSVAQWSWTRPKKDDAECPWDGNKKPMECPKCGGINPPENKLSYSPLWMCACGHTWRPDSSQNDKNPAAGSTLKENE